MNQIRPFKFWHFNHVQYYLKLFIYDVLNLKSIKICLLHVSLIWIIFSLPYYLLFLLWWTLRYNSCCNTKGLIFGYHIAIFSLNNFHRRVVSNLIYCRFTFTILIFHIYFVEQIRKMVTCASFGFPHKWFTNTIDFLDYQCFRKNFL